MWTIYLRATVLLTCTFVLSACESVTAPQSRADGEATVSESASKSELAHAKTTGGGKYELALLDETFPGKFSFAAIHSAQDVATGRLRFILDLGDGIPEVIEGGVIEFHGDVTCLSVDRANGRAWVGGVITKNRSSQPFYRGNATTQVGKDIWFRVLDDGEGRGAVDRTTFVGFEGNAGIITSQEYCDARIWPDDNARTNPVVAGNIQVQ